ncbi:Sensory box histidine kinase [Minicystis rosea]|nr:Sensory box histidine kinase [Minicystis rosea]
MCMSQGGPYVEQQEIHRGRRYSVARVTDADGAPRILKLVRSGRRAAQSAALLDHEQEMIEALASVPGVVRSFGRVEVEGVAALVLEDAGSHNLKDWLRRRPLGVSAFLARAIQLADTIAGIHRENIIHRDLNATNIVVSEDGDRFTVIDFGLATSASGAQGAAAEFEGTLRAIAPEQTGRISRLVDHRADLYSLGATFYEMITGRPPFSASDPAELVHAHLARAPAPPTDTNRAVPPILGELVLKLLAKMPEQRYQSAEALAADLREIERRHRASGAIDPFDLGRLDRERELVIPGTIRGRDRETSALAEALSRAAAGAIELFLVTGSAGVGKSTLVRGALASPSAHGARCLSVKFDELRRNIPHGAVVEATRDLVRRLLREPKAVVDVWRGRIGEALRGVVPIAAALVPELAELLGYEGAAAGAEMSRLALMIHPIVQALAAKGSPLVLFLDDLQWADAASLRLLRALAGPEVRHVLIVGSYRSDEVTEEHPLTRTLDTIRRAGIAVQSVPLAPLDLDALTLLCADVLRCSPDRARPLAAIVQQKTAGNPFFVERFLRHLHRSGLIAFDRERGAWIWDARRAVAADVTENVLELMGTTIRRLPKRTQRVLMVASCLPGKIEIGLLAAIDRAPVAAVSNELWSALREGLLVPDPSSLTSASLDDAGGEAAVAPGAVYRFVHDRVQQAAYSLLSAEEQQQLHLRAGFLLLEGGEREIEEHLFAAVDQLDRGADLLHDEPDRTRVAELMLRAAVKARGASAFGQALRYATRGLALLPAEVGGSHQTLRYALTREAAEDAYLTGDFAGAIARIDEAIALAPTAVDRVDMDCQRIITSTVAQDSAGAIGWAREALARFGLVLPDEGEAAIVARTELVEIQGLLQNLTEEDLLAAPAMHEPDVLACMRILSNLTAVTWLAVCTGLFSFVVTRMVGLSLRHGMAPESGGAFTRFGMVLGDTHDDFTAGYWLSRIGLDLARRHGTLRHECRAQFGFSFLMSHWHGPLRATLHHFRRALEASLACGDLEYAAFAREYAVPHRFAMGAELDQVLADIEDSIGFARKLENHSALMAFYLQRQAVRCLQGRTRGLTFDDDEFDTCGFLDEARRTKPALVCRYETLALQARYLLGDLAGARAMSAAATAHLAAVRGTIVVVDYNVYTSLALAASCAFAAPEERERLVAAITENQRRLARWALRCPESYRHKHLLVSAELARITGGTLDEQLDLYEQAIDGACRERFLQDEALSRELAGRCLHARGRRTTAAYHLQAAVQSYARWGANAKAEALEEEFRGLLAAQAASSPGPIVDETAGAALDVISLLKAAETLSSEVVLDRLLEKLMTVCLEAAGAQRGALILDEEGARVVRAVGVVSEAVSVAPTPLAAAGELPCTLIEDVFRTGDSVVLADAAHQGRFTGDPHIAARAVRSVLAVPIRKQARTAGVLYLENDLTTRAFTTCRVRVVELLSSEIAVSLDNSLLFEKLKIEIGERARAEQALRFLAEASALLSESLDYEATLVKVARLAVPYLADWCVVDVFDRAATLERVAAAHFDPVKDPLLRELCERYPPRPESGIPAAVAIRTGAPYLCADLSDALLAAISTDTRHIELIRALGSRSLIAVPLIARDRSLGAMTFFTASTRLTYGPTEVALAEELARRAAFSIDNARLYQQAQEAIRLREDFVAVASHELNTPITSLQLAVQALSRSKISPPSERLNRALLLVERQGLRLATLVGEMLDISRIREGRLELDVEPVDLSRVARDAIDRLSSDLERARCTISLHADVPVTGLWDRARLVQVATNLLTNAAKFGKGKPIAVTVDAHAGTARLVVEDQGIGIDPAQLSRIFDRFERGVSVEHYGGLGLGLYIVREIVGALGGSVRAVSTIGSGSSFVVELPCAGPKRQETVNAA